MNTIYKGILTLALGLVLAMGPQLSNAAVLYGIDKACGDMRIAILATSDVNYTGTQSSWNPLKFTVRYPMTAGAGVLGTVTNQNGFQFTTTGAPSGNDGTYYYQTYVQSSPTSLPMTSGTAYLLTYITITNQAFPNVTDFEIPASDNGWVVANNGGSVYSNINGNQHPSTYSLVGIYSIPLYDGIFWNGTAWCGGSGTNQQPGATDGSLNCYVNGMGASLTTPVATPAIVSNLTIGATSQLTIQPGAALTVTNVTTINSAQGLIVAAGVNGAGSFINNATVANTVYGAGASATVQIYMANTRPAGTLHNHLVGDPVYDATIADPPTTGPGYLRLSAYNLLAGSSFAYRYRETTNSWVNIYQLTDSIPRLGGISLSDISGVSKTLALTGKLNTGNVNQPTTPTKWAKSMTTGQGEGLYLFSNPYACGLDLAVFQVDNGARLTDVFWTWEQLNATYGTWFYDVDNDLWTGTGNINTNSGIVGPGQGFFGQVTSLSGTTRTVAANERVHAYVPTLKSLPINFLRVKASGNESTDELIVKFNDKSSYGFDQHRDIENWPSMVDYATEINTVADGIDLTVNSLPLLTPGQMTSVPMDFTCGAEGNYTITASNIESFETGTEIWLEDLQIGGEWYSLNVNPVYEFTAAPGDPEARFVLHFFGPTGIDDPIAAKNAIQIYGYQQNAYIVNHGTETVKEYRIYDMMGRELHGGTLVDKDVNVVPVNNISAYYIVKVFTKEGGVYTGKVFIAK
jgi:hypothetical protein